MPVNVIQKGKIILGKIFVIGDNVTLGHRDDGTLEIGDNAVIRSGSIIYSDVKIGANFRTGHNALVREKTVIGNNCLIGTNAVVDGSCTIGNNLSAQTNVYITTYSVIEDDVFMGPCSVTTNDKYMHVGAELKGPVLKKGCRLGANCTILPGVVVGEGAVIGSGSVVVNNVKPGAVMVGNPAREIKRSTNIV